MMLRHALKEWAVICKALANGRQSLIIRKGGIAEAGAGFELEHNRFWLYPTYTHQQAAGLNPEGIELMPQAIAERPPAGMVRLSHFAESAGVYRVHDLFAVLLLNHLHLWSEETIEARFAYRQPGLHVIPLRVYRASKPVEIREAPAYAGCRSWLELEHPLTTDGGEPVIAESDFGHLIQTLDKVLKPIGLA
jgi:hypothetical protein